jgi:YgiT-type zinc finger domain-containing protein
MSPICIQCRIGRIQPITAPYITSYKGQVSVLPAAPAYVCDVCDYMEYDAHFLGSFQELMHEHEAGESYISQPDQQLFLRDLEVR